MVQRRNIAAPLGGDMPRRRASRLAVSPKSTEALVPQDYPPPPVLSAKETHFYHADAPAAEKYRSLGKVLAAVGDIYRHPDHGSGLIHIVRGPRIETRRVETAVQLEALIADSITLIVVSDGKPKDRIPPADKAAMLASEIFLGQFCPLDRVIDRPYYLPDFKRAKPGYCDAGPGHRYLVVGGAPTPSRSTETIDRFLHSMSFASIADRTNAVAAALTVMLGHLFPGAKPIVLIGGNKSHCGKGTIAEFVRGNARQAVVGYETTDWAFRKSFEMTLKFEPDTGMILIDIVRLDRAGETVRSAFLEAFLHDPEPMLNAPGTGKPTRIRNRVTAALTANNGQFSEDLINRGLLIVLEAIGDVATRSSAIGDPKGEYLPAHRADIEAELMGMIDRWIEAGKPLANVRHGFLRWARTIGGILELNGYRDFLSNAAPRKSVDDPVRRGLALLGANHPDNWRTATDWAALALKLGLRNALIPPNERETASSRARGLGKVMSAHQDERLTAETDDGTTTTVLRKARRRFDGKVEVRYRFEMEAKTESSQEHDEQ